MIEILMVSICALYVLLIGYLYIGFEKVATFRAESKSRETSFSVVIPFRNEAKNLPTLLNSIKRLTYPTTQFEILLVDDDSQDVSAEIIKKFMTEHEGLPIKLLSNHRVSGSPKKDAIATAIKHATGTWILTSDADCELPSEWLRTYDAFILREEPKMVVGPVIYTSNGSFIEDFQLLDFMSLMASTIGGFGVGRPFLCNGANLAYQKDTFLEVQGFEGNDSIASGDDIFLLEKMVRRYPDKTRYLKSEEAIVKTQPQPSWAALREQQQRWAAKASAYKNTFGKLVGLLVFLTNFGLVIALIAVGFGLSWKVLLGCFIGKAFVDFLLVQRAMHFFNKKPYSSYLLASVLYPIHSTVVAISALFRSEFEWKGRRFKR